VAGATIERVATVSPMQAAARRRAAAFAKSSPSYQGAAVSAAAMGRAVGPGGKVPGASRDMGLLGTAGVTWEGSPETMQGDQTTEVGRADGAIFGCQVPVRCDVSWGPNTLHGHCTKGPCGVCTR
jgi:hypothetical protein